MLSISTPMKAAGCVNYHLGHAAKDYYLEGERHFGQWFGQAVDWLGLPERIQREAFHHLLNGFTPDGRRALVQNAGDPDRASAWDLTFSAPKSVSVLWAMAPQSIRGQIEQAQQAAVQKALTEVEAVAGITRRGQGGRIREHGKLVFATFFEGTSRALDPAIHTHAVLVNLALRQDGTTGTLHTYNLFDAKMRTGALYRAELAEELRQRLGLVIDPERVGFHVRGVPKNLCEFFSTRRRTVVKAMQARGLEGAVAAKLVTLLTRPKKSPHANANHFERWHEVGQQYGWGQEQARLLVEEKAQTWTQSARSDQRQAASNDAPSAPSVKRDGQRRHEPSQRQSDPATTEPDNRQQGHGQDRARRAPPGSEGKADPGGDHDRDRQRRHQKAHSQHTSHDGTREETGRNARRTQDSGAAEKRRDIFRMEWRRLFSRAPFWSPAQFVKVPWLVFPEPRTPWGPIWSRHKGWLGEVRVQERRVFPNAPEWSPLRQFTQSAVRVVPPAWLKPQKSLPRWWSMHYKRSLPFGEFRVQDIYPFRSAPRWNPLRKWHYRSLRFTTKRSKWTAEKHAAAQEYQRERMRMAP